MTAIEVSGLPKDGWDDALGGRLEYADCNAAVDRRLRGKVLDLVTRLSKDLLQVAGYPHTFAHEDQVLAYTFANEDQVLAFEQWLVYLTLIFHDALEAATCLYLHGRGRPALALHRQAFECTVRALFFESNLEEALFQRDFASKEQRKLLLHLPETTPADLAAADSYFNATLQKNPVIGTSRKPKPVIEMLKAVESNWEVSYNYYYRGSSQHFHQSGLGMAQTFNHAALGKPDAGPSIETPNLLLLELAQLAVVLLKVFARSPIGSCVPDVQSYDVETEAYIVSARKMELGNEA